MNSMDSALRLMAAQQPAETDWSTAAHNGSRAAAEPASLARPLFASDRVGGSDDLGRAGEAAFLAELILHEQAQTPFCVALLGPSGSGKSVFLETLLSATGRLAEVAATSGAPSPFCTDVLTIRVDAANDADADALLLGAVVGRIAETHPALAVELRHAGADPAEAARKANGALDEARRKLDVEREALAELTGREARLIDAVIDAPGSHVDAFARSKRSQLDRTLRQFGFASPDPIATYKDLVREAAEASGPLARAGLVFRALWAYKGQTRLVVSALVLFVLAWVLGTVRADQANWLQSIRDSGERAVPLADWLQTHLHWLAPVETGLLLIGVFLLLLDVIRAARFVLPLARGVDLLQQDLDGRRRDLTSQLAHQTRRVDALQTGVELAAREASEAERRAGPRGASDGYLPAPAADTRRTSEGGAAIVFQALQAAMSRTDAAIPAPRRVVVAIDGLDQRSSEAAVRLVSAANRLLGEGCVTVIAAQQSHLMTGFGETDPARALALFARCVQLPYRIGAADASDVARRAYAVTLMDGTQARPEALPVAVDPSRSALDAPWQPREAETVAALAPLAGETPRAIKRFVNLYRVARADPRLRQAAPPVFTALALALALDAHGFPDDLSALARASHGEAPGETTVLRKALAVARDASGQPVELGQAQRALDVAESYTARL